MALLRVVTQCQITCSCGKAGGIATSHDAALKAAAGPLTFCRVYRGSKLALTRQGGHMLLENLWINIGRRASATEAATIGQLYDTPHSLPTTVEDAPPFPTG